MPIEIEIISVPDENPDPSYLYQDDPDFSERRAAYERGDFGYIGIYAQATVTVNGTQQTLRSAGLWGIEDDSDPAYLAEVAEEERRELRDILQQVAMLCGP